MTTAIRLPDPDRLTDGFLASTLNPENFNHHAHVAVAFTLLRRLSFLEAATQYCTGIRALAASAGVPQKFNLTVTLAFLSLIAERMKDRDYADFAAFSDAEPEVFDPAVLLGHYTPERLGCDAARETFLLPDRYSIAI